LRKLRRHTFAINFKTNKIESLAFPSANRAKYSPLPMPISTSMRIVIAKDFYPTNVPLCAWTLWSKKGFSETYNGFTLFLSQPMAVNNATAEF
jgi:hypothetical protein